MDDGQIGDHVVQVVEVAHRLALVQIRHLQMGEQVVQVRIYKVVIHKLVIHITGMLTLEVAQ